MAPVRCTLCHRPAGCFAHWLCRPHRAEAGRAFVGSKASEADLLRELVFRFPAACGRDEFVARVAFVSTIWKCRHARHRRILRTFGLLGKVGVTTLGVERGQLLGLITDFVAFVCAHLPVVPQIRGVCDESVGRWYGSVVLVGSRDEMLRSERMLLALERATGARGFLVLSDLARALSPRLPADAVERVYAAYLTGLSDMPRPHARAPARML
jgi:hypothetical protein